MLKSIVLGSSGAILWYAVCCLTLLAASLP